MPRRARMQSIRLTLRQFLNLARDNTADWPSAVYEAIEMGFKFPKDYDPESTMHPGAAELAMLKSISAEPWTRADLEFDT